MKFLIVVLAALACANAQTSEDVKAKLEEVVAKALGQIAVDDIFAQAGLTNEQLNEYFNQGELALNTINEQMNNGLAQHNEVVGQFNNQLEEGVAKHIQAMKDAGLSNPDIEARINEGLAKHNAAFDNLQQRLTTGLSKHNQAMEGFKGFLGQARGNHNAAVEYAKQGQFKKAAELVQNNPLSGWFNRNKQ